MRRCARWIGSSLVNNPSPNTLRMRANPTPFTNLCCWATVTSWTADGEKSPINSLRERKNEHALPYFFCMDNKKFGVSIIKVGVSRSEKIGFGPGRRESPCHCLRRIGAGMAVYSEGLGAEKGLASCIAIAQAYCSGQIS